MTVKELIIDLLTCDMDKKVIVEYKCKSKMPEPYIYHIADISRVNELNYAVVLDGTREMSYDD